MTKMQAVHGKRLIYLFRPLSLENTSAGMRLAYTKENEKSMSKDADVTATKDGPLRSPGELEIEITATSVLAKNDKIIPALKSAMENNEIVEIWEVNLDEPAETDNKYKGTYYQGYVTEQTFNSPSDDWVEVNQTFGINGKGVNGEVTIPQDQMDEAMYVFKDTTKVTAE